MPDDQDVALTVALAEYEYLREVRRAQDDKGTTRFNFYMIVASAATAVAAGLVTGVESAPAARFATVAAIGALVLMLGVTVFVKQVEYASRDRRFGVAIESVRTFLARRAPQVAPYLLLPTFDDAGLPGQPPSHRSLIYGAASMTGMVGSVNSLLTAGAVGAAVRYAGAPLWIAVAGSAVTLAAVTYAHVWYARSFAAAADDRFDALVAHRFPT